MFVAASFAFSHTQCSIPSKPTSYLSWLSCTAVANLITGSCASKAEPLTSCYVVRPASRRSICVQASFDAVTNLLVDVTPVFERTRQNWRGHAFLEVTNYVRYQTITRSVVHHLAHERASLTPVFVITAQRVSGLNEFAASLPLLNVGKALRIGLRAALGVRRIDRV